MIIVTERRRIRPEISHNEMDGVVQLQDLSGQAQLRDNPLDSDLCAPCDGESHYSNAGGIKRAFANMRANHKEKLAQKRLTKESKAAARTLKAKAKLKKGDAKILASKAQQAAAKGLGNQDDSATIAALNATQNASVPAESTGLSKGAKIGIGVGIGVVLLIVGVVVYKKMKAKKGK